MGNIAAAPSGVSKFYHALFGGEIVSPDSLVQMQQWKPFTAGHFSGPGGYGDGLFQQHMTIPLDSSVKSCGSLPSCKCGKSPYMRGCYFDENILCHPGLDYGSGMPFLGYVPGQ